MALTFGMASAGLTRKLFGRPYSNAWPVPIVFRKWNSRSLQAQRFEPPCGIGAPDFAFTFDIDGVLMHGGKPYPPAKKALKLLESKNIEFLFLTNGGGKLESERVKELSQKLEVEISEKQFVQSHTPFKKIACQGGENGREFVNVLVHGGKGEKCREVALSYGFKNVIIPADIFAHDRRIWPFGEITPEIKAIAKPLPSDPLKIDAIFVFSDPVDWGLDIQIILDLLLSKDGVLGTYSPKNDKGDYQNDGPPLLYFSNPDLLWASDYHLNRLAQGAFRNALEGVWRNITALDGHHPKDLACTIIGKPHSHTFAYAEEVLNSWRKEQLTLCDAKQPFTPLRRIYMVGDNPESDIKGANDYNEHHKAGAEWFSILVETGVYRSVRGGRPVPPPKHTPKKIVKDVWEAVCFALETETGCKPEDCR